MLGTSDKPKSSGTDHRARGAATYALIPAVLAGALLLWALFWPANECDQPSCARQRYSVGLEVDALGRIEPISFEVAEGNTPVSLMDILRDGGIELTPEIDQLGLPYDLSSGPLDRADLFQLVTAWRNRTAPDRDAMLYALFVNALIADNGEQLFGVMFDTAGREGFAVAPKTTERYFRAHEATYIDALQLRTFAHELLHALNRHHADAMQTHDGRLTLEAPTRCISRQGPRGWMLLEPPLLALSPKTIRFFQTATARDVLPGPNNSPFTSRRASPTECDDARRQSISTRDTSRWGIAMRRLRNLFWLSNADAAQAEEDPPAATPVARIRLQAQPAPYPLGYPVAVRVMVDNTSEEALPIAGRLNPRYGMLMIDHRKVGDDEWLPLQPITWFEPTNDEDALLQPGEHTEETIAIFYGDDGWTFAEPGDYEIRARLQLAASSEDVLSEPLGISIVAPTTPEDREALQPLLDADGQLAKDVGRFLYFGGRIGDRSDIEPLELVADQYGHTAIGAAMRLTLLSQRLRRPIDPATGMRPAPDFDDARELLEDTCTDSGVAAMTSAVLEQRSTGVPTSLRRRAESDAAAWDGTTRDRTSIPTYSDPNLQRRGASLHFCFNEAGLRRPVRRAVSQLARELRQEHPSRIVLVGHTDSVGTCRYNDSLALRRARAVQRALAASGLDHIPMATVSIGERRPMSFAAAAEAQQLNRRVEILVESTTAGTIEDATAEPVIPDCPGNVAAGPEQSSRSIVWTVGQ